MFALLRMQKTETFTDDSRCRRDFSSTESQTTVPNHSEDAAALDTSDSRAAAFTLAEKPAELLPSALVALDYNLNVQMTKRAFRNFHYYYYFIQTDFAM